MGLILDTSILIATEKKRLRLEEFFSAYPNEPFFMAAITASELLHGVERAAPPKRKQERLLAIENFFHRLDVLDFDLAIARRHATLWAFLKKNGTAIGLHDMQIAATALTHDCGLATLNLAEFRRVPGLRLIDTAPFTP